jgi:hypothetical protein
VGDGPNVAFAIVIQTGFDIEGFLEDSENTLTSEQKGLRRYTLKRWPINLWKRPSTSSDIHWEKKSRSTASRDKVTRSEAL